MQKPPVNAKKVKRYEQIDQPIDHPNDRAGNRVACMQLKMEIMNEGCLVKRFIQMYMGNDEIIDYSS